jgi:hypothetical protein
LPLFKQWGETPEVRKDPQQLQIAMAYIVDIQQRIKGTGTAAGPTDQSQLLKQAKALALQTTLTDPSTGEQRVPHKPPVPDEMRTMEIKELGNFAYDPDTDHDVPADVKTLDGIHVRLNGYMIPLTQADALTEFALVPNLVGCCFGLPPGVQHVVTVRTNSPKGVKYTLDNVEVEGVLHVEVKEQDRYTYSIFELQASSVK